MYYFFIYYVEVLYSSISRIGNSACKIYKINIQVFNSYLRALTKKGSPTIASDIT